MNRNKLKSYAPEARRDFIQAVTDRAALYGFTAKTTEPMTDEGDVAIIAGRAFPKSVGEKRKKLAARIGKVGFEQTIEAMAYTWFNRLVAIRYMELHGYPCMKGERMLEHLTTSLASDKKLLATEVGISHATAEIVSRLFDVVIADVSQAELLTTVVSDNAYCILRVRMEELDGIAAERASTAIDALLLSEVKSAEECSKAVKRLSAGLPFQRADREFRKRPGCRDAPRWPDFFVEIASVDAAAAIDNIVGIAQVAGVIVNPEGVVGASDINECHHTAARIKTTCEREGVAFGSHAHDVCSAQRQLRKGAQLVVIGTDAELLKQGSSSVVVSIRQGWEARADGEPDRM